MEKLGPRHLRALLNDTYSKVVVVGGILQLEVKADGACGLIVTVYIPERSTFVLSISEMHELRRLCADDQLNWGRWIGKLESGYGTIAFDIQPSGRSRKTLVSLCTTYRLIDQVGDRQKR